MKCPKSKEFFCLTPMSIHCEHYFDSKMHFADTASVCGASSSYGRRDKSFRYAIMRTDHFATTLPGEPSCVCTTTHTPTQVAHAQRKNERHGTEGNETKNLMLSRERSQGKISGGQGGDARAGKDGHGRSQSDGPRGTAWPTRGSAVISRGAVDEVIADRQLRISPLQLSTSAATSRWLNASWRCFWHRRRRLRLLSAQYRVCTASFDTDSHPQSCDSAKRRCSR